MARWRRRTTIRTTSTPKARCPSPRQPDDAATSWASVPAQWHPHAS
jgi:hypothetical protein